MFELQQCTILYRPTVVTKLSFLQTLVSAFIFDPKVGT